MLRLTNKSERDRMLRVAGDHLTLKPGATADIPDDAITDVVRAAWERSDIQVRTIRPEASGEAAAPAPEAEGEPKTTKARLKG